MRERWARRGQPAGLILLCAAACLDPNADFDGPVSTTGGAETSTVCEGDGFDNEDTEASIQIGSYTAVLETPDTRDRFDLELDADAPNELYIAADVGVRVCAFIECTSSTEPSVPSCMDPATSGSSAEGQSGCCGSPGIGLAYTCDADMGAKFHIVIDEAPAECTRYDFEVATAPP